jgi:hypothetical protein
MNSLSNYQSVFKMSSFKYILLISLILYSRTLAAQINTTFFKVSYATSQSWSGGAYGSGSGVYYNFHIAIKKTATIHFDSVWIDYSYHGLFSRSAMMIEKSNFKKGDSVLLSSEIYYPGEMDPTYSLKVPAKIPSPCKDCKSSVVILFRVNGKLYYYDVKNIIGLEPINYP